MGTNYYVRLNECACCGRYDQLHIGKSSHGWAFSFRGYTSAWGSVTLRSWTQWKEFLNTNSDYIYDEYGEEVSYNEFVQMVEVYKAPGYVREDGHVNLSHNVEGRKKGWFNEDIDWDDDLGYSFSSREFS